MFIVDELSNLHKGDADCEIGSVIKRFDTITDVLEAQRIETKDGLIAPQTIQHFCNKCLPNASWENL